MTTPTPVQRTLFTLWENESQENELRVLLLPGCPFDSNDFTLIQENPDAGQREIHPVAFVDP
jgi:hypothetical protein